MTRRLMIALAVLAVAVVGGFTPWPAPQGWMAALVAQTADRTGLSLAFERPPRIVLLPQPRLEAGAITVVASGETVAKAARASGGLRLAALAQGRLDFADLTVVGPRLAIADAAMWAGVGQAASHAFSERGVLGGLDRLVIFDGALQEHGHAPAALASVNLDIRRSAGPGSIDATGSLRWRGEEVAVEAGGFQPDAFGAGRGSPLALRLDGRWLKTRFEGQVTNRGQAEGALALSSADLPSLHAWLGVTLAMPLGGKLQLSGQARVAGQSLSVEDARVALDAGVFEGVASARLDGERIAIGGTLATDRLDLSKASKSLLSDRGQTGWSQAPFEPSAFWRGNADLRLSAGQVVIGRALVSNAALSILSRPGRVDLSLGAGEFLGGGVKGRLGIVGSEKGVEARLQGSFDGIDAGGASALLAGAERVTGSATGAFAVEGSGESTASLMRTLEGKAALTLLQGELRGVNVPELLRRLERRPLVDADVRGGKTPFETASATARIAKGVAEISDAAVSSPVARLSLAGAIDIADRTFRMTGKAQAPESSGRDPRPLPFGITGPFEAPAITPDPGKLSAVPIAAEGAVDRVGANSEMSAPAPPEAGR